MMNLEDEVAKVRSTAPITSPSDAIARLEREGHSREISEIRLDDSRRAAIVSRIRQDRLARRGKPVLSPEMVRREVIASERLEGIDARDFFDRI